MKIINTKRCLQFDISMQISFITLTAIIGFLTSRLEWSFMTFYFGLGAFQLISFFVHLKRRLKNVKLIRTYAIGILGSLIFGLVAIGITFVAEDGVFFLFIYLYFMLIAGPTLAVIYLVLSIEDLGNVQTKIKEL